MNAKRKKLVTVLAIILAALMLGSVATMTVSMIVSALVSGTENKTSADAGNAYSFDLLAEEAPTFNTTVPTHVLTPEILHKEQGSNGRFTTEIKDDYCVITPTGKDPYYYPMSTLDKPTKYVVIGYRSSTAANTTIQFFMGSTGTGPTDDTSMLETAVVADGQWHASRGSKRKKVELVPLYTPRSTSS